MIQLQDITMTFTNNSSTPVLNKITLDIEKNDWVNILGTSGSGKTTLLNIIGGLLKPTEGTIHIDNVSLNNISKKELQEFRRNKVGYIYQDFKLFNQYTVLENVMVPQLPYKDKKTLRKKAEELLEQVGLNHRLDFFPTMLSGGEKQRVAIARALLNSPDILLCDEPTGNLDSENTEKIMQIIQSFYETGLTIIFVTHDQSLSTYSNKLLSIQDGKIKRVTTNESTISEELT